MKVRICHSGSQQARYWVLTKSTGHLSSHCVKYRAWLSQTRSLGVSGKESLKCLEQSWGKRTLKRMEENSAWPWKRRGTISQTAWAEALGQTQVWRETVAQRLSSGWTRWNVWGWDLTHEAFRGQGVPDVTPRVGLSNFKKMLCHSAWSCFHDVDLNKIGVSGWGYNSMVAFLVTVTKLLTGMT